MSKQKIKKMPSLRSDEEAEHFVESSNLSTYNLSGFTTMNFEFEPKSSTLNMRLPQSLLNAVKSKAQAEGMPYTRFIRLVLEKSISGVQ